MSPATSPETVSPRASGQKVQDGRIEKPKAKKESKAPTYRIGGRTFACEACKKGHRVSKCTHASERPVSMTNDPGRPSGDQKRRCDCPKQCACTTKNCKCDRNCSCTQKMYMLVYVPMKDGETGETGETGEKYKEGEWKIGHEVITDLHGKKLTNEEIQARNELKQLQQNSKSAAPTPENLSAPSASPTAEPPPKSCCQHKKNIEEQKEPIPVPKETLSGQRRPQCNCGTGCACAFCLDHPNNQTSHLLAQQQAAYFSNQTYGQQQLNPSWAPMQIGGSCMGTNPRFAISNTPNPSHSQFQTLFSAAGSASQGGYFISYPFTRYSPFVQPAFMQQMHLPIAATPISVPQPTLLLPETSTPTPSLRASTSSCCHTPADAGFSLQSEAPSADAFDFSTYDIGNAVASGWNDFFDGQLSPFPDEQTWEQTNEGPPDITTKPIPNAAALISPISTNAMPNPFPMIASLPSGLSPALCSHQSCCQQGIVHSESHSSHHGPQSGIGLPFYGVPTPMVSSVYARSPS